MSDKEIISFLNTTPGNICGNFRQTQLNREISMPTNSRRRPLLSVAAIVAALTVAIPSAQAKSKTEKIQITPHNDDAVMVSQQSDTISRITGIVNDWTHEVLIGAVIRINTLSISAVTDTSGRFEIQLPSGITEKSVRLTVHYVGFMTQEFIISLTSDRKTADDPMLCITMEPTEKGGIRRAPLWYRLKYKVRHLFR
ncbi:carboxypeptidase-like regulatory domain-containing protein [Chitinophaga sp. CF418]|uniref:carboxypeptidase-like regulatory domain-containing protein n=1 Tax=Chitinophaga sp. CF418 TaxID=1855287 RepID=UPI00165FA3B6|nr:carboxypeptidase-like regulatory domain-containing protein [Chitinophaga sp. CF418]